MTTAEETIYKLSEEEWNHHRGAYDGLCLACGEWSTGGVEPDARKYKCTSCQAMKVYGAEEVLIMDRVEFTDDD